MKKKSKQQKYLFLCSLVLSSFFITNHVMAEEVLVNDVAQSPLHSLESPQESNDIRTTEVNSSVSKVTSNNNQATSPNPSLESINLPLISPNSINKTEPIINPELTYSSHVQDIGWQTPVSEGEMSGTTGKAKQVEAVKINLEQTNSGSGNVEYRTFVTNNGWQNNSINGQVNGTTGQNLSIEAIQIWLTGDLSLNYDIYYRTHIERYGWLDWTKNGASSGSNGQNLRMEAFEIKLLKKGEISSLKTDRNFITFEKPSLSYQSHVADIGWQSSVKEGALSGTVGKSKQIEAFKVFLTRTDFGNIEYRSHVENIGWQPYVSTGQLSGTVGKALQIEAIQLRLTGKLAEKYSIKYRVHVQDIGWQNWVFDDRLAGTVGKAKHIEGIEILLVDKVEKPVGLSASQGNYSAINKVIYLDAGHGGYDPGASYFGQTEKALNLSMQNLIKSKLEKSGYTVVTTRNSDIYTDLVPRSLKANNSLSDLFVSLHFNASTSPYANGIETYYYKYYEEYPSAINELYHNDAERLRRSSILANAIQSATVSMTGAKNNGVLRNTFAVLRETTAPAVLLELGYMSNQAEFQKINSIAYQEKLAQGVVSGILSYYKAIIV